MGGKYWHALTRRKTYETDEAETKLNRVLTLFDLTALGVGSTLGLGVYVLAGSVAYENAGPAVTISFLVAAIASALAGLCYAEFATRVTKAGSAYVYSYVTIGELVAFTIGWNLILEYVIGTSSVARGLSGYLDSLLNGTISRHMRELMPMDIDFLADYPDFFAFAGILVLTALLAFGVKESTIINNIFTTINLLTIITLLGVGSFYADSNNWFIKKEDIPSDVKNPGEGGFMPFGIAGVMAGAAKCFFGFVGFDCIATTGEEAINPKRNIPLAILMSLVIIFLAYFGISTVLTMMIPYFAQNPDAPFPHAFEILDLHVVKWIVTIGAVFALCTSLIGAMFPLPRVIYAMSEDGVIFRPFRIINNFTKTPIYATILSGLLAGIMALMFDLGQLIDMMSIGTLLAYTIVSICVLVLRYEIDQPSDLNNYQNTNSIIIQNDVDETFNLKNLLKHFINFNNKYNDSTNFTSMITKVAIIIYSILTSFLCLVMKITDYNELYSQILLIIIIIGMLVTVFVIWRQPRSKQELTFNVPLIPLLPCLSVFFNLYLMFQLDIFTWIRFVVWLIIGFLIYFGYGVRHSTQGIKEGGQLTMSSVVSPSQKIGVHNLNYFTNDGYVDTELNNKNKFK